MRSMTGYGSGRSAGRGVQFAVEVQSVNRRQCELVVHLPRELLSLEHRVRDVVNAGVARGRLTATVTCQGQPHPNPPEGGHPSPAAAAAAAPAVPALDVPLAHAYHRAMLDLQRELGVGGEVTIDHVLRAPGVLRAPAAAGAATTVEERERTVGNPTPEAAWPHVAAALHTAMCELLTMREREGQALARDLGGRLAELRRTVGEIQARQPAVTTHYREALRERIARAGVEIPLDADRLAKEVAIFADRSDISEELTRLHSHLEQFEALLGKHEPVGRALDFLGQEMAREFNTLGVKGNDLAIAKLVLAAKAELEKAREQVQNVE